MHDIEPFYLWREQYTSSEDKQSPFYKKEYSEFLYTNTIYNYYIHPQWDDFGSATLYIKVLYADYESGFAIIEFIGEWNDCLYNDIMILKENLLNHLMEEGIYKFMFICENVLNFHGSDDCYYEELYEEVSENSGWICFVNLLKHVEDEMTRTKLQAYVNFINDVNWRKHKPQSLIQLLEMRLQDKTMELY
jgi:hypothetical protein